MNLKFKERMQCMTYIRAL